MTWVTEKGILQLGNLPLTSGVSMRAARISWKAHGRLNPSRDNVVLYPTSFAAQHTDLEWLIGPDKVLDPTRWFVLMVDMFGNGLSSSPSNDVDYPALVVPADNVVAQRRLLNEVFQVRRIACVYGWSMGAQQAYHWAALFPEDVERIVVNCGSARTSPHNKVFLASLLATLEAAPEYLGDGRFREPPVAALRAFGRIYAGWAMSQDFYRAGLHLSVFQARDLEEYLRTNWDSRFAQRHAENLYAHLMTWMHSDISANTLYKGDLGAALRAIRARVLLLPGATDLYFRVADNETELTHLRSGKLQPIPSIWGHIAGNPQRNPQDAQFLRDALHAWLGS